MPEYHVYWVSWLDAYRVFDPKHREQTVAYVEDLSEITEQGFDYILEEGVYYDSHLFS